jgi:hypothetical protein
MTYVPKAYPPDGSETFWELLRNDIENKNRWLEVDVRHYARSLINRVAAQGVSKVDQLRPIVKHSKDGHDIQPCSWL